MPGTRIATSRVRGKTKARWISDAGSTARARAVRAYDAGDVQPTTAATIKTPTLEWTRAKGTAAGAPERTAVSRTDASRSAARNADETSCVEASAAERVTGTTVILRSESSPARRMTSSAGIPSRSQRVTSLP